MKFNDKQNRKYTLISVYVVVTAIVIYILGLVARNMPVILGILGTNLSWLLRVIRPVVIGFALAYLCDPLVDFFERRLAKMKHFQKKPRKLRFYGVLITVLLIVIGFVALISVLVYSVTKQIRLAHIDDVVNLLNDYTGAFHDFVESSIQKLSTLNIETQGISDLGSQLSNGLVNYLKPIASAVPNSIGNITSFFTTIAFSVMIGIWFMIDGRMIMNYMNKVMYALTSEKVNERVHGFLKDADFVFSGYIRGQLMDAFVMLCLISISLSMVGVRFSVLIGVIAGIGNLVPYLGPFFAYAGTVIVCLIEGRIRTMVIAIVVLFIIQTIDGNFIGPKLLSKSVEVHPLLVTIFLIFGSAIGGFLGMLIAVPIGALIKLLFVRFIDHKVEKKQQMEKEANAVRNQTKEPMGQGTEEPQVTQGSQEVQEEEKVQEELREK